MRKRAGLYQAGGGEEGGATGEEMNAGVGNNRGLTANKEVGRKRLHSHSTLRSNLELRVRLPPTQMS